MPEKDFPFYHQVGPVGCGEACLRMVAAFHGLTWPESILVPPSPSAWGSTLLALAKVGTCLGFRTEALFLPLEVLHLVTLPCITYIRDVHFAVIYEVGHGLIQIADPAIGLIAYAEEGFRARWLIDPPEKGRGIVLVLELAR